MKHQFWHRYILHSPVLILLSFLFFLSESSAFTMNSVLGRTLARKMRSNVMLVPRQSTRLFGSKRGVPGNPLGKVEVYNDQDAIKDIDEKALQDTVHRISKILG